MLIYVDKKKERRKKIKILCCILIIAFVLLANIFHFKTALHQPAEKLISYQPLKFTNNWFEETKPIYFFTSKNKNGKTVIVIPEKFNRENATALAFALAKIPEQKISLYFTPEITEDHKIIELAKVFHPEVEISSKANIILTTELEKALKDLPEEKLYPTVLHYKYTAKSPVNPDLDNVLNALFPPQAEPQTRLEKELAALKKFAADNKPALQELIFKHKQPDFYLQNLFLENINLCLITNVDTICDFSKKTSLEKKLTDILETLSEDQTPQKLLLLTSNEELPNQLLPELEEDDGLIFKYGQISAFLLPNEWQTLTNPKEISATLKSKAGLNPNYDAPNMKFYRFKTMEVILDEEI